MVSSISEYIFPPEEEGFGKFGSKRGKYTMGKEELLEKDARSSPRLPWACAALLSLLLTGCFAANVLVTHHNLLRCGRKASTLPGCHKKVTCTREDSGPQKPGADGLWGCCPAGWRSLGPGCFLPLSGNSSWADSERNCSNMGAHLASISTQAELDFTTQFLQSGFPYFLGLTYEESGQQWQWVDGTPFDPHAGFWHRNKPTHFQEGNCAVLVNHKDRWAWSNFSCAGKASRICELPRATFNQKPKQPSS
ncbi:C-type lectin domain family 4 member D isoform X2 [Dipodomys spectabilis]|uniref:C-type lectin domain family 4 member D isoform X2 n=1 Tax=Dipodomys spectabilis TaxID=105255 RepID=UPI001C549399|nr:C-type lectin domain family 4 member D isoform X2 [Dipodomys spectabilis]